jgi:hypothetical protein
MNKELLLGSIVRASLASGMNEKNETKQNVELRK